jgi:hypothetical protein
MDIHLPVSAFIRLPVVAVVALATIGCAAASGGGQTPTVPASDEPAFCGSPADHEINVPLSDMDKFIDVVVRGEVITRTVGDYPRADGKQERWRVHEIEVHETLMGVPGQIATVYSRSSCLFPGGEYYLLLEDQRDVEDAPADYVVSSQSIFRAVDGKIAGTHSTKSQYEGMDAGEFRDLLVTEVASGEVSPTAEPDRSAIDNFLAQLDNRSIAGIAPLGYGRIEHCLDVPGRGYEVASGGRIHIFLYQDELAAQLAAENVPADADCGPIDWVVDVRYYRCGELIVFLTSQEAEVLNALVDLCGQPFATGQARF